ncbi:MAG: glycine cleavage system protein GcvH [Candidatus Nanoarchaeia archaeon]
MKAHNGTLPADLLYNKDYSWVKLRGDVAEVGIIEPAAKKVKEFVFIKLPEKSKIIKQGDTYVSLEAVKWSGHLSSPVSGEVIEVNEKLFDEPSKINRDPYGSWIMKVKIKDKDELNKLMKPEEASGFYSSKIK